MTLRRRLLALSAFVAALVAATGLAGAETYPSRPVTVIVPFAAGGPTDVTARIITDRMQRALGQPIVVEDVGGAGGSIAAARVARAVPDGYTLELGNNGSNVLVGALYSLPVDIIKDFEPVAELTVNPQIIISNKQIPAADLKQLLAWLKDHQNSVSVGIAGPVAEVSVVNFETMTGMQFQLVPYRGAAPAIQDLIAGHIDIMVDQLSNSVPQIRAGTIRAYAIASGKRSAAVADVPTTDEAGLPGFYGSLWHGLWAPKGTPPDVVAKLNAAAKQALADPAVRQRLADLGQDIAPVDEQTPAALGAFQQAEKDKWWPIVKAANMRGE
ncbi:MAG TPA: tripartite tricarboxylate transporter substrate-binding protein [Xanthobacteraceae bacterium]|nr:tripartite tricarboxylate transporter substrate-binding protein [Xanthobacteraceae bacterium]